MGLIWELMGDGRIRQPGEEEETPLEQRLARIEADLAKTNRTLMRLLEALEDKFGEDLDGDGRIGSGRASRAL